MCGVGALDLAMTDTSAYPSSSPSSCTDAAPPSASYRRSASHCSRLAWVTNTRRSPPLDLRSEIS